MDAIRVIGKEYFAPLGTGLAMAILCAGQFSLLTGRYLVGVRPLDPQAYVAALLVFLVPCLSAIAYAGYRAWYRPPFVELKRE